ncbi:hypothetical protein B0H14DRAFT_1428456 [Mycena olivaceomarginata]|nr:hypothetical protein B0H14DRAFT_1428456 [Mycena olivaceomarginata]
MTTRSPSVSSFLPSSSPNESRSFSPYAPWDPVRIPDAYSHYSKFKYRLWFICRTWYTIGSDSLPWFSLVSGENANGDLWLWEDEDEEGIREFAIGNEPLYICEEDWDDAVLALEMRFSRITVAANPVAHLPSQARLRFMAWLLVVVAFRECRISESPISTTILIRDWAEATGLPLTGGTCNMCGVSGVLPVWIETMLEIYPRDDLRSLPWHYKCNCLHR